MTIDEFNKTAFYPGMRAIYKGNVYTLATVDFDEALIALLGVVLGQNEPSWVRCENIELIASGTMNGNQVDKENARLIAAAPELLEAAIELKDVCNRPSSARTRAEAWRKLDKAIAKALQPNA